MAKLFLTHFVCETAGKQWDQYRLTTLSREEIIEGLKENPTFSPEIIASQKALKWFEKHIEKTDAKLIHCMAYSSIDSLEEEDLTHAGVSNWKDLAINKSIPYSESKRKFIKENADGSLEIVNAMCVESLDPETFEAWENVLDQLHKNRSSLKRNKGAGTKTESQLVASFSCNNEIPLNDRSVLIDIDGERKIFKVGHYDQFEKRWRFGDSSSRGFEIGHARWYELPLAKNEKPGLFEALGNALKP